MTGCSISIEQSFFNLYAEKRFIEHLKYLVVITGPTAVGKTAAAIAAARHFNTEIVSADSRQLYRELSIGTAVPDQSELAAVKHHFIQSHSIFDGYNASLYETEAIALLENLFIKQDVVILTGGSMLYIDAVCKGIDDIPDVDPEVRDELKHRLEEDGIEHLRLQLRLLDPDYYQVVDLRNPARIVHALEVCLTTGKSYSSFRKSASKKRNFNIVKSALNCNRNELHKRINSRVDVMLEKGLEQEARDVYGSKHLPALNTVGYRELFDYFDGNLTYADAVDRIKRNSRRYARKQLTWFRKDSAYSWFQPHETKELIHFIETSIAKK